MKEIASENEKREALLATLEIGRQVEELQEEQPRTANEGVSFVTEEPFAALVTDIEKAGVDAEELFNETASRMLDVDEADALNGQLDERVESLVERFHELGDVEGMMAWRGEKEARLKGLTFFAQYLVGSAFKPAARDLTGEEWIRHVLDWVAQCPKLENMPCALAVYRLAIAPLQASGPLQ